MGWFLAVLIGLPLFFTIANFWGGLLRRVAARLGGIAGGNRRNRITIEAMNSRNQGDTRCENF